MVSMRNINRELLNVVMRVLRCFEIGESTGYPSETGLNIDADEVSNYAVKHPRYEHLFSFVNP